MNKFKDRLNKIKNFKAIKNATDKAPGERLPDGRYLTKLESITLAESKSSGRDQINMFFTVLEGDCEGRSTGIFIGLDDESLEKGSLRTLVAMGFPLPEGNLGDYVDETVETLQNDLPEFMINVKNGWSNVVERTDDDPYISSEEGNEEVEEVEEVEEAEEDEQEVSEGSLVTFTSGGKEVIATVEKILEEENKLVVVTKEGKKLKVSAEKASLVVEEKEEVEEEEVEEVEDVAEEPEEEVEVVEKKPKKGVKPVAKKAAAVTKKAVAKKAKRK